MSIHLDKDQQSKLIEQIINLLKEHEQVCALFNRFEIDPEYIHQIGIEFAPMDVSAKANKAGIKVNRKFLEDGNIVDDLHYLVHELTHVLQFMTGRVDKLKDRKFTHYLDNPLELEAFREQIRFIKAYKNEREAQQYLKELLDFHEIKGTERRVKEEFLRS